jgi:hypothetical protein
MGMLNFSAFSVAELQRFSAMLSQCERVGITDIRIVRQRTSEYIARRTIAVPARPARRRQPDNITPCPVCGKPAVIVPLPLPDRSPIATHAIQCQNRPATDKPWRDGMCGHTEYIVRGDK